MSQVRGGQRTDASGASAHRRQGRPSAQRGGEREAYPSGGPRRSQAVLVSLATASPCRRATWARSVLIRGGPAGGTRALYLSFYPPAAARCAGLGLALMQACLSQGTLFRPFRPRLAWPRPGSPVRCLGQLVCCPSCSALPPSSLLAPGLPRCGAAASPSAKAGSGKAGDRNLAVWPYFAPI